MSIPQIYQAVSSIGGIQPQTPRDTPLSINKNRPSDFKALLDKEVQVGKEIQLSNHAQTRIRSRQLPWNSEIEHKIAKGIESAQSKGSCETLILADEIAVIANVKSRTVITAMDRNHLKEHIFTNIDSAVLV